jgi:hypothetical protein
MDKVAHIFFITLLVSYFYPTESFSSLSTNLETQESTRPKNKVNHKYPSSLNHKVSIYGPGITDIQAALIESFILSGIEEYKDDKFNNAVYIQDLIENSNNFGGKWIVEIVDKSTDGKWAYAG